MRVLRFWPGRAPRSLDAVCVVALGLSSVVASCTFYTGTPAPPTPAPANTAGTAAAAGGKSSSGGSGSAGDEIAGAGGAADGPPGWVDATGDLVGRGAADGNVILLEANPGADMLVAGVNGLGLWASSDGGKKWRGLGQTGASDLISHWVTSIVFDPADPAVFWETGIYGGGGVFSSLDGGVTTQQLGVGMVSHNDLVSIDFSDPERKTLLAGWHERQREVSRSTDGGATWEPIGANLPESCGYSNAPLALDAETYLVGCVTQIVRSTDGGGNWDVVSSAGGFGPPLVASDGSIYWRIDANFGLMRSEDGGQNWLRVAGPGAVRGPVVELADKRLASMNETHVVLSEDAGQSWVEVGPAFPFTPGSVVYSNQQRAFFIWAGTSDPTIPAQSIMRYDWDYEAL